MSCPGANCPSPNETYAQTNQTNVNALLEGDPHAVLMSRLLHLAREAFASGRFLHDVDGVEERHRTYSQGAAKTVLDGRELAQKMFALGLKLSNDALAVANRVTTQLT